MSDWKMLKLFYHYQLARICTWKIFVKLFNITNACKFSIQVLVVAFKKRKLQLPGNPDELNQISNDDAKGLEVLHRTEGLK